MKDNTCIWEDISNKRVLLNEAVILEVQCTFVCKYVYMYMYIRYSQQNYLGLYWYSK